MKLFQKVLIGFVLGAILGAIWGPGIVWIKPIGDNHCFCNIYWIIIRQYIPARCRYEFSLRRPG